MTLADRVKQDLTSAMKAGEKDRVGALHLTGMDLETDEGEMLTLQAELLSW